jgi:hypothetical protein
LDKTFLLSTRGTALVSRALVAAGLPVEGGVFLGRATATVTIKPRSAGGGNRFGAASAVPLDAAHPIPLQSHPRSSLQLYPWYVWGSRSYWEKVKKGGNSLRKRLNESRKSTRNAMTNTHLDAPMSSPAGEALALRFRAVALGPRGWLGKRSSPGVLSLF